MKIKSKALSLKLSNLHDLMIYHIFNMATKPLKDRFLPIKVFDDDLKWVDLLVWDNEKETLHGPFNPKEIKKGNSEDQIIIVDYRMVDNLLYVYCEGSFDLCIMGLQSGNVSCVDC